jgi:hypothetical protein
MLSRDGLEIKRLACFPVFLLAHNSRVNSKTLKDELGYQGKKEKRLAARKYRFSEPF